MGSEGCYDPGCGSVRRYPSRESLSPLLSFLFFFSLEREWERECILILIDGKLRLFQKFDNESQELPVKPLCSSVTSKKHPLTPSKMDGWYVPPSPSPSSNPIESYLNPLPLPSLQSYLKSIPRPRSSSSSLGKNGQPHTPPPQRHTTAPQLPRPQSHSQYA